jgi:putative DNA primase/helicase
MDSPATPSAVDGLNDAAHALFEGLKKKPQHKKVRKASARTTMSTDALTEDRVAMEFAQACAERFRYCHHAGAWFQWTGARWIQNETGVVREIIRELSRALSVGEEPKVLASVNKASFYSGVDKIAQGDTAFAVTSAYWDQDPMLLGTPAGTIDLRTGELRAAAQSDGITKTTTVAAGNEADCPIWMAFLNDATGGDADLMRFLQQWAGYCLTGDVSEHSFVFIYGPGGNGKSVWLNTIAKILGDYQKTAPMETFTASHSDRHPTDLAGLRGARLVAASETEEGRPWAEAKIKSLTGGDPVAARFMRQNFFTYSPQFKLVIIGNHKPRLRNVDDAMRRRINIVPFVNKPERPDPKLEEKLKGEWPAILRWMINGCLDWQKNRLVRPDCIAEATANYFEEQDLWTQWLDEECENETDNPHKSALSAELFASWAAYAKAAGVEIGSRPAFAEKLRTRGFYNVKGTGGARRWKGIQLRQPVQRNSQSD